MTLALRHGADTFVLKPYGAEELRARFGVAAGTGAGAEGDEAEGAEAEDASAEAPDAADGDEAAASA